MQCFKCLGYGHVASTCPTARTMTMLDDGTIVSEDETSDEEM